MKGKKNLGIVGFSYDITDIRSRKELTTKREVGRKTPRRVEIAHGYNWSDEHWWGYGRAHAYLADIGPFYSVVGGYTDYTSENSKSDWIKGDEWGTETPDKFYIYGGYSWNPFLNKRGYSHTYFYLAERENVDNVLGGRIQVTSENSKSPWIETGMFGNKNEKEMIWGKSYGWSEQYGKGYNHFSLYVEDVSKLDDDEKEERKDGAVDELQDTIQSLQLQLEREKNKNKFLEEQMTQIQIPPKK